MEAFLRRPAVTASLLIVALVAWAVTVDAMRGMDAGPGTNLGSLGWFMGVWVTMMAAIMLPSAVPIVSLFSSLRRDAPPWAFVLGYLLAWAAVGLGAYALFRALRAVAPSFTAWDERGAWVAGGALVLSGIYQLTPLKAACLRNCRTPIGFLLRSGPGAFGAVRTGLGHGAYCIGCCAGLMLALFALGVMSLVWMAGVTVAILAEKMLPAGEWVARALAVVLAEGGVWMAAAPESVPGLTQPDEAEMRMDSRTEGETEMEP